MTFVASPRIRSVGCVYADRCVYAPRICAGTRWWVSLHGWVRIRAPQGAYTQVGAYTQARGAYKRVGAFTRVAGCVYAAGAYMHARVCTRYAGRCVVNRASRAGGSGRCAQAARARSENRDFDLPRHSHSLFRGYPSPMVFQKWRLEFGHWRPPHIGPRVVSDAIAGISAVRVYNAPPTA